MVEPVPALFDEVDEPAEARADARAEADVSAGRIISHEAMKAWILSWGTSGERPLPKAGD